VGRAEHRRALTRPFVKILLFAARLALATAPLHADAPAVSTAAEVEVDAPAPHAEFSGKVRGGETFEKALAPGLVFRLQPRPIERAPKTSYLVWLGDPANPEENYCAVDPLSRDVVLWGAFLRDEDLAREKGWPSKNLAFRCAESAAAYRDASWALRATSGHEPTLDERTRARMLTARFARTALEGRLLVTDFRLEHLERPDPEIESLKFDFQLSTATRPLYTMDDISAPIEGEGRPHALTYVPDRTLTLEGNHGSDLLLTLHRYAPEGSVDGAAEVSVWSVWLKVGDKFRLLKRVDPRFDTGVLSGPPAHFRFGGKRFIDFPMELPGTGHFRLDEIDVLTPGDELQQVAFEHAPDGYAAKLAAGEGVWKGELNTFADDDLQFQFYIWKDGDRNCCPSGGAVTGKYKVVGADVYDAKYDYWPQLKIVADSFQRADP